MYSWVFSTTVSVGGEGVNYFTAKGFPNIFLFPCLEYNFCLPVHVYNIYVVFVCGIFHGHNQSNTLEKTRLFIHPYRCERP
ncbi:hypothetical protein FKM82_013403 [Ascaphus truei]